MRCTDTCCVPDQGELLPRYMVLNRRMIKSSRVPHTCWYCGHVIPVGSRCSSETAVSDGTVSTLYKHYPLDCAYRDGKMYPAARTCPCGQEEQFSEPSGD